MNDYDLLLMILDNIKDIKELNKFSSREEFSSNDQAIKLGIGLVTTLLNLTEKLDPVVILTNKYLAKEIPLLNRYKEHLFNRDNSINAYKLYDFLTYEVVDLEKETTNLLNTFAK